MTEPKLMPFQEHPFNGDTFIEQEFIVLRDRFGVTTAVETGTCLGYTTLWLAKNFKTVVTIEKNVMYSRVAERRYREWVGKKLFSNVRFVHGDSGKLLITRKELKDNTIFFLDAHWGNECPLLEELQSIAKLKIKPVIAIHDFVVPESSLGFDLFKGQPFDQEWIADYLDRIYGNNGYDYYYNSDDKSAGAKRGIIYITPNITA